ncbi:MAG: hypothetical protein QXP61_10540 [Nitrososphaerales archaeon]
MSVSEGRTSVNKAAKLMEIALSTHNTSSERIRAIELLGRLEDDGYEELAHIAANGLTRNERINALEALGKKSRHLRDEVMEGMETRQAKQQPQLQPKPQPSQISMEEVQPKVVKVNRSRYSDKLTDDLFDEMLQSVKPLLMSNGGCSESEIKKQFRNLKGSLVESFLTKAITKGMIREVMPGMFQLVADI